MPSPAPEFAVADSATLLDQLTAVEQLTGVAQRLSARKPGRPSTNGTSKPSKVELEILEAIDRIYASLSMVRMNVATTQKKRASRGLKTPRKVQPPQDLIQVTFDNNLASGALLESAAFQKEAHFSRQALSKAVQANRIFYLEVGGVRAYPAFYLDKSLDRAKVEAVSKALGSLPGGSKWLFFTQPFGFLALPSRGEPQTPLDALREGRYEKVLQAANGHVQG